MNSLELEEGDWYCSMNMGIEEVRYLYNHFKKAKGDTKDEKEYIEMMRKRLFAMMAEFALTEL